MGYDTLDFPFSVDIHLCQKVKTIIAEEQDKRIWRVFRKLNRGMTLTGSLILVTAEKDWV